MTEFQKRLEANIRESLRFAVGEVQDDAVAHMLAGVNAVLNHSSAPSPEPIVAGIVPPHCSGYSFVFEPGVLHVKKDGSGHIVVNDEDFVLDDDRCEGEHGPEGSIHWITRMGASEITALRNPNSSSACLPASMKTRASGLGSRTSATLSGPPLPWCREGPRSLFSCSLNSGSSLSKLHAGPPCSAQSS